MINLQNNSRFGIKEMDVTLVTRFLCAMVNLMESRNWVSEGLIRFYCKGKGEKGKEKKFFFFLSLWIWLEELSLQWIMIVYFHPILPSFGFGGWRYYRFAQINI